MIAPRTATRAAARQLRARNGLNARHVRFASTNQQAAAAGGSSGLVGGIAGGALVFFVRLQPFSPLTSISQFNILSGRVFLLLLLRRQVHRERRLLHKITIQQTHLRSPKIYA
jgi:hypothetical protein